MKTPIIKRESSKKIPIDWSKNKPDAGIVESNTITNSPKKITRLTTEPDPVESNKLVKAVL